MVRRSTLGVGALVAAASTGHVLYPAWLAVASRRRPQPPVTDPEHWPAVTVLVAAYAEAECIGPKVRDVLANGYPGPIDVMVVADADVETAARAEHAGATVVTSDDRLGKAQALNLGFSKVTAPIVVVTDANNVLSAGAIAALVRHFGDPRVGAVAGEKVEADGAGEDLYWRFESWLKQREWRLGTTIGLVGELAAIRTDAWRPIPADIAIDDLWTALDLSERGLRHRLRAECQGLRAARAHRSPAMGAPYPQRRRRAACVRTSPCAARARRRVGGGGGLGPSSGALHRVARRPRCPVVDRSPSRPDQSVGEALPPRPRHRGVDGGPPGGVGHPARQRRGGDTRSCRPPSGPAGGCIGTTRRQTRSGKGCSFRRSPSAVSSGTCAVTGRLRWTTVRR